MQIVPSFLYAFSYVFFDVTLNARFLLFYGEG
jgi:hypothetical protein